MPKIVSLTANRATIEDIEATLLRAPNFLASLGLHSEDGRTLPLKQLGLGHYAHAFALPSGDVLKVTDDEEDARVCKMIFDYVKKTGTAPTGLPYVRSVHRLPGDVYEDETDVHRSRPLFAIVMEPVTTANKTNLSRTLAGPRARLLQEAVLHPSEEALLPSEESVAFVRQIRDGVKWLSWRGVEVVDLHHGNLGYASGKRPVIIDFGHGSLRDAFVMKPITMASNSGRVAKRAKFPAFLSSESAAVGWAKRYVNDLDWDDDRETLEDRASEYAGFAQKAWRNGSIEVHRAVSVPSHEKIRFDKLGKSWSYDRRGAGVYNKTVGEDEREVVLTAVVQPEDVDWEFGFTSFMYYGTDQSEVSMLAHSPVEVIAIDGKTLPEPVLGSTGASGELWTPNGRVPTLHTQESAMKPTERQTLTVWRDLGSPTVDMDELRMGIEVEQEHTGDMREAGKIAMDHLREFPDYYTRLTKMEARAKAGLAPNGHSMIKVRAAFDECFDALVEQFPDFGDLELHHDEKAGGDNGHGSERQFGYCMDGSPIRVAFAAKTEDLPVANIRGLMAHEFGHALDYRYGNNLGKMLGQRLPAGVERRADAIAKTVFGRTIKYDSKDVQCVACQGKSVRPRRLGP